MVDQQGTIFTLTTWVLQELMPFQCLIRQRKTHSCMAKPPNLNHRLAIIIITIIIIIIIRITILMDLFSQCFRFQHFQECLTIRVRLDLRTPTFRHQIFDSAFLDQSILLMIDRLIHVIKILLPTKAKGMETRGRRHYSRHCSNIWARTRLHIINPILCQTRAQP